MPGRVYVTVRCPSVCPSVCPSMGPQQQTRCCILFGAQQQRRANAGSDMLLANVGSWTQICTLHNFFSLYQALYTDFDECVEFIPGWQCVRK